MPDATGQSRQPHDTSRAEHHPHEPGKDLTKEPPHVPEEAQAPKKALKQPPKDRMIRESTTKDKKRPRGP